MGLKKAKKKKSKKDDESKDKKSRKKKTISVKSRNDIRDSSYYYLEAKISGKIPKRSKDESFTDMVIGKASSLWEGLKDQLFGTSNADDKRKIIFTLKYIDAHLGEFELSKREHPYLEKFLGYFEISGFNEILAFDILVDAPMQWDLRVFINNLKNMSKKNGKNGKNGKNDDDQKYFLDLSDEFGNIEKNRNLFLVKSYVVDGKINTATGDPFEATLQTGISKNVLKGELLKKSWTINTEELPFEKGVYLSLAYEPYSRFYTHKRFEYLLRKLKDLNLTFYFGGTTFGVSQLLVSNDEISYLGGRIGKGVSEKEQALSTFYNVDLAINKGFMRGLKFSFDYWPAADSDGNNEEFDDSIEAFRFMIGYKYSFLLPLVGAIDLTPTLGLWSYQFTTTNGDLVDSLEENFAPSLGIRAGYGINFLDFIISGYGIYSTGFAENTTITSVELGVDIGYELSNIYKMRHIDPAIYGFIANQDLSVENKDSAAVAQGFEAKGLTIGIGMSVVWE